MLGIRRTPDESLTHVVVRGLFGGFAVFSVLVLVFLGLLPRLGWYRPMTVLSGSMEPSFYPGDLVIVRPKATRDVKVGDVITYNVPVGDHHVESHRIVDILSNTDGKLVFRTQGDANNAVDPWTAVVETPKVWTVAFPLRWFGWPIHWLRDPLVHRIAIFGGTGIAVLLKLISIWRPRRHREQPAQSAENAPGAA
jgi:signal peptidase